MQKVIAVNCECTYPMCDHIAKQIAELLQETFDDGYDEGWVEAYESMRKTLQLAGVPGVELLEMPNPPPRSDLKIEPTRVGKKQEKIH